MLHIGTLTADYQHSSMNVRDALYMSCERMYTFFEAFPADSPLHEMVPLCTCNRISFFYVCEDHTDAVEWLYRFMASFFELPVSLLRQEFRNYRCAEAVRHLFRVASGVESLVFGEHEILGQVRSAYHFCFENRKTDSYLNRLFQQAIATGKKVRSKTSAGRGALSIASVAIDRMKKTVGDLRNRSVLVIGLGAMGERALKRIAGLCPEKVTVSNRTDQRAIRMAQRYKTSYIPYKTIPSVVGEYDIILLATSSPDYIITRADIDKSSTAKGKLLMIIDLGAPRNAEPSIGTLQDVMLIPVDDLKESVDHGLRQRKKDIDEIDMIIDEQVTEFTRWYFNRIGICNGN